ncbi:hypothetical protein SCP_0200190 [Sparassis crispa]|uniref:Uncharacterized protein n=1 Tax=Sparassis crispa TaxID=139825 RepID=A0A401G9I3_9APHY|nr:hypothetical protein SCP_0200190 [Sparassis crispa]GBE78822.1 hypothetical protein SCP_0200190 [Sparassis crispa]
MLAHSDPASHEPLLRPVSISRQSEDVRRIKKGTNPQPSLTLHSRTHHSHHFGQVSRKRRSVQTSVHGGDPKCNRHLLVEAQYPRGMWVEPMPFEVLWDDGGCAYVGAAQLENDATQLDVEHSSPSPSLPPLPGSDSAIWLKTARTEQGRFVHDGRRSYPARSSTRESTKCRSAGPLVCKSPRNVGQTLNSRSRTSSVQREEKSSGPSSVVLAGGPSFVTNDTQTKSMSDRSATPHVPTSQCQAARAGEYIPTGERCQWQRGARRSPSDLSLPLARRAGVVVVSRTWDREAERTSGVEVHTTVVPHVRLIRRTLERGATVVAPPSPARSDSTFPRARARGSIVGLARKVHPAIPSVFSPFGLADAAEGGDSTRSALRGHAVGCARQDSRFNMLQRPECEAPVADDAKPRSWSFSSRRRGPHALETAPQLGPSAGPKERSHVEYPCSPRLHAEPSDPDRRPFSCTLQLRHFRARRYSDAQGAPLRPAPSSRAFKRSTFKARHPPMCAAAHALSSPKSERCKDSTYRLGGG